MPKINRIVLFMLLFIATPLVAACVAGPETSLGGTWTLQSLNGEELIPGSEITAQFGEDQILGNAGCNSYQASYEQNDNQLAVLEFVATEVFCEEPEGVMDQEGEFMVLMLRADHFEIQNDQLTLSTTDGETLVFERQQ